MVRAEILLVFINVNAPNQGSEGVELFKPLKEKLRGIDAREYIALYLNYCSDFTLDRMGEEPNLQSSCILFQVFKLADLVNIWRMKQSSLRQYSRVKISEGTLCSARLDRF